MRTVVFLVKLGKLAGDLHTRNAIRGSKKYQGEFLLSRRELLTPFFSIKLHIGQLATYLGSAHGTKHLFYFLDIFLVLRTFVQKVIEPLSIAVGEYAVGHQVGQEDTSKLALRFALDELLQARS